MTWLAVKLFLGGLWKRLVSLFGLALRYPWQAALIVAVCALFWTWRGKEQAEADKRAALTELQRVIDAGKRAEAEQIALNQSIQRRYEQGAKDAQRDYDASLARSGDLTRDYIAANRVRPGACPSRPSDPAPASGRTGVPEGPAADPVVVEVSEPDVRICGDLYSYASAAHEWAKSLGAPEPSAN